MSLLSVTVVVSARQCLQLAAEPGVGTPVCYRHGAMAEGSLTHPDGDRGVSVSRGQRQSCVWH